jgi:UDPglucose--hexose-1-phosphate uridylyltransferase
MPELRKDPVIGRWVIISTERGKRPTDFDEVPVEQNGEFCPFCYDHEDNTPPEIFAIRRDKSTANKPGWTLRVIPNKFPALRIEGRLNRQGEGIYDKMSGIGAHEVVIETPDHEKSLSDLEISGICSVFRVFRERILDLRKDTRLKYVMIFKNHGKSAGASLNHTHSQLIATPIIPKTVIEEIESAKKYYEYKDRCIFCDIIRQEIMKKSILLLLRPMPPVFLLKPGFCPKNIILTTKV